MNRTYRLQFCRQCKNKTFSSNSGIICSLTNEQADFQENCEHYIQDESVQVQKTNERLSSTKNYISQNLRNYFNAFLITLYISMAVLLIATVFIVQNGSPTGLIIGGLISIAASIIQAILIYHIWDFIITEYKIQGDEPPIDSPGKAVGYLFIPFYNFYWLFQVYGKIMESLNNLAESRKKELYLPNNLGILICIFTLSGIIPIVGTLLALIAMFVLIPVLFHKAIQAIEEIPPFTGKTTETSFIQEQNKVKLSEIRDYSELFDTTQLGFNYKLVLVYLIASIFNYALINLAQSQFRNVYSNVYFLTEFLFQGIFIFSFILSSSHLKKIALPFVIGFLTLLKNVGTYLLFYFFASRNYSDINIHDFIRIPFFIGYFIYGVFYVSGMIAVIKFFGVRFWSMLIYSICLNYSAILIWIIIGYFDIGYNFEFSWNRVLIIPLIQSFLIAISFYFGFLWHYSTSNRRVYNRSRIDMLDSGL